MKEGGGGGRCGDSNRRQKNNFGSPFKAREKLKGGGVAVGRCACSRTANGREKKYGWVGNRYAGTKTSDAQVGE